LSEPPEFSVRLVADVARQVLTVTGEVDLANAKTLKRFVDRVIEGTDGDITLDLADVGYMDSTGLDVLLSAREALSAAGRELELLDPSRPVLVLLEVCGLTERISIVRSSPTGDNLPGNSPRDEDEQDRMVGTNR